MLEDYIEQARVFLEVVFAPGDAVLFRPIETWIERGMTRSRVDCHGLRYSVSGFRNRSGI